MVNSKNKTPFSILKFLKSSKANMQADNIRKIEPKSCISEMTSERNKTEINNTIRIYDFESGPSMLALPSSNALKSANTATAPIITCTKYGRNRAEGNEKEKPKKNAPAKSKSAKKT